MNGVIGMTELALDTDLSDEQREYLRLVRQSADSLLQVINDILDFSKIEAGKLHLENDRFALRECIGEAISPLGIRAHGKGLELVCDIRPDVPDVLVGDALRLRQVIINLIGNAIKFTDDGEIVVTIQVAQPETDRVELQFSVTDSGIGIDREKVKSIFEAFEQADGSTTRQYGGTGLGLPISAQLVDMMGGQIWVDSEPGQGSTFHFTARFEVLDDQGCDRPDRAPERLGGQRVLIVDDNETNRRVLREMVSQWGLLPTCLDKAGDALDTLLQADRCGEPFPLVLLDFCMPGQTGGELAEAIRDAAINQPKMVLLSSASLQGEDAPARPAWDAFVLKPIQQSTLLDTLMNVLNDDQPEAGAKEQTKEASPMALTILLAEDNPVNQKLAIRLLEKMGHAVTVAGNGRETLDQMEKQSFDVVLMDVQMPELDGMEATRIIRHRERESGGHQPIIAMTAHAMKGDREKCLDGGMDGYVSKPIRPKTLQEEIQRVLADCRDAGPVESPLPDATVESMRTADIFDEEELLERVDGDSELAQELLELFTEQRDPMFSAVRDALASRDSELLRTAAHTLKGALGNISAKSASEAARLVEYAAAEDDMVTAAGHVTTLRGELERLAERLQTLQEGDTCEF
jgi:signal transduction histidine kinase